MALEAAALAHCAGPERYFGFLDVLFETQENWARAEDHLAALKRLGKLGGLTEAQMDACFADQELADRILQTRLEAQNQHDISSTPTLRDRRQDLSGLARHRGVRPADRAAARLILSARRPRGPVRAPTTSSGSSEPITNEIACSGLSTAARR